MKKTSDTTKGKKAINFKKTINLVCPQCDASVQISDRNCPACDSHLWYPNVKAAMMPDEQAKFAQRYKEAKEDCKKRNCEKHFLEFEKAVRDKSKAIKSVPLGEAVRISNSNREVFGTFYRRLEARCRLPDDNDEWNRWRVDADSALFPSFVKDLSFALLALDYKGSSCYGDWFLIPRTDRIKHRSSVFVENSTLFFRKQSQYDSVNMPRGWRATWEDRGKLAALKRKNDIHDQIAEKDFSQLLYSPDTDPWNDDFIEVQISGSLNIETVEVVVRRITTENQKISGKRNKRTARGLDIEAKTLMENLKKYGVDFKEIVL